MVAIISLATGVVRDLALGPYQGKETGETALFRTLWDGLEPGEIVLGDRYFGSFFGIAALAQRVSTPCSGCTSGGSSTSAGGGGWAVEDHVVTWAKPERPDWMDEATYAQIPDELTVRELRVGSSSPGSASTSWCW